MPESRGAYYELPGQISPQEVAERITWRDTLVLYDWEGLIETRHERVRLQKHFRDSNAMVMNGVGQDYDWGYPPPWRHDGNEPGSAVEK